MDAITIVSWVFLTIGGLCAVILYTDINMGRYQRMAIMNIAWVITALYSSLLATYMYFKYGRAKKPMMQHEPSGMPEQGMNHMHHSMKKNPMWVDTYISSTHCGAGCGLADIISETFIYLAGITLWGAAIWASYVIDYAFALVFGLAFQYFNIRPMRPELSAGRAIIESLKADFVSLTSFQIGMYAWMYIFNAIFHWQINAGSPVYWFMMQIGLTLGLLTTFPVNGWLIKKGIKVPCMG